MSHALVVPIGWNALEGRPDVEITFEMPAIEVMLSEVTMERLARINMPMQFSAQLAVAEAMKVSHDADEALYHRLRPTMMGCPFDTACRFV